MTKGIYKLFVMIYLFFNYYFSIALKNINKMLKQGGSILLFFMADFPLCHLYKKLGKYYKYAHYMRDLETKIPDYFFYINKEAWFEKLLLKHGFSVNHCNLLDKSCRYNSVEHFLEFMKSVETFSIPEDLLNSYYKDLIHEARKMNLIVSENNTEIVRVDYQVIVASATKGLTFVEKICSCCR